MAVALPQDVLDDIIHHVTDIDSLSQCALTSKILLEQTRFNQFAGGVRITSRNRKLVSDILSSAYFFIPLRAIRAVTITSIQFAEDGTEHDTTILKLLTRLSHIQILGMNGIQWSSLSAANRQALSIRLPSVTQLDLHDIVVSSPDQVTDFVESFPLLSRLSVQRVDISHVLSIPTNTHDLPTAVSTATMTSINVPGRQIKRLELSVDDSDALLVVQAASSRVRFSEVVFWRSPFDESTKSYTSLQNEILRNLGDALVDLTFVVSGFNAIALPSDLSNNTNLERVNPVFIDMNLRRVGSRPFTALLATLSSIKSASSEIQDEPRLREINLTFHFDHWIQEVDCNHLCTIWNWQALDEVIISLVADCSAPFSPSSPSSSVSAGPVSPYSVCSTHSQADPPPSIEAVTLNFDWGDKLESSMWMEEIEGRIRSLMHLCQSRGIVTIRRADASEYVNKH